jgi:tetratricopeptide (TPR) repeat protein
MNCSVQILHRKDEERRLLSELIIADLAFPGNPWETLRILSKLGYVLVDQGRYKTAEEVVCRLVEGHRSRLGDNSDDIDMMFALETLGRLRTGQKLYAEAERLYQRIIQGRSAIVFKDPTPFHVLHCNILGIVLLNQNKLEEAESAFLQAMEEAETVCGPKHRVTLLAAMGLGSVLNAQGRYEEAEAILNKSLALSKELGLEGEIMECILFLAKLFVTQERLNEAKEMLEKELALAKKASGPETGLELKIMARLGSILEDQGRFDEAEAVYEETLVLRKKLLGPEHPETLKSMEHLGSFLRKQKRSKDAEKMHRDALVLYKRILGPEHPDTVASMIDLGAAFVCQEKYEEAEAMFREALALRRKVLGHNHHDTLKSIYLHRLSLECQGRFEEAESVE